MMEVPHVRFARPTDHLQALVRQYECGLGLTSFGGFEDHEGFDGAMLGHPGQGWHMEFTTKRGHKAGRAPTEDNLLVFYIPDEGDFEARAKSMLAAGFLRVVAFNPYWDRAGVSFEDLDGYRVVLVRQAWNDGVHED